MYESGSSLETIAARVDATPDEVQEWMNDYKEITARVRKRFEPQLAGHCKECGGAIPFNVQCIEVGDEMYHTGCWQN